jgi:Ulp1 family protease
MEVDDEVEIMDDSNEELEVVWSNIMQEPAFNSVTRVEKYCQFEGQSITMEDYYCLKDESFLNDVIIDFYFKWIQHKILKETTFKENIHIFTTYFYKRYTILV